MLAGLEFHHIGYACRSIEKEVGYFESLGFVREGDVFTDPKQGITGLFLTQGSYRVELLEPLHDTSPVLNFLAKGQRMYHQGFLCRTFDESVESLRQSGAIIVSPPTPAIAFENRRVCFIMLRNMMLIELIEA